MEIRSFRRVKISTTTKRLKRAVFKRSLEMPENLKNKLSSRQKQSSKDIVTNTAEQNRSRVK